MNQTTPADGRTLTSWSPDATTLEFFLRIYVKNLVYWVKNKNIQTLRTHISDTVARLIHIMFNPLNAKLNSICHLLLLLGAHLILYISRIRVNKTGNLRIM